MSDSIVIIPTYNEIENIERIIRKVFSLEKSFDVLIIEDNSPDGTADKVKSLMPEFKGRLFIEERKGKLGLGTAYIHGFKWALNHGYQYIFEMDADFSHNPDDLPGLYKAWIAVQRFSSYRRAKHNEVITVEHPSFTIAAHEIAQRGFDHIIFGHTHYVDEVDLGNGKRYFNPGASMIGRSYIEVLNGKVCLLEWDLKNPF